jgi:hypothetical protein
VASQEDARRVALALPAVTEGPDTLRFAVEGRQFAWRWAERVDPKKARVPSDSVIAVRIATELDKEPLIEMRPEVFFTEPHYDGYAAILVRLAAIDEALLAIVLRDAWRARASRRLLAQHPEVAGGPPG